MRSAFREIITMKKPNGLFGFVAILIGVPLFLLESASAQNWEQTNNELKAKIVREYSEPGDEKVIRKFLMNIWTGWI